MNPEQWNHEATKSRSGALSNHMLRDFVASWFNICARQTQSDPGLIIFILHFPTTGSQTQNRFLPSRRTRTRKQSPVAFTSYSSGPRHLAQT